MSKLEKRFWEKVNVQNEDECWEWLAAKNNWGYGSFRLNGQTIGAHKVAYLLEVGDVSDDMFVCHTCDNPGCVNPVHLFLGTHSDNMADMIAKGRSASNKGSDNGNAKLTEQDVEDIRSLYATGKYLQRELAKQFGVSRQQIGDIVRGEKWGWLL